MSKKFTPETLRAMCHLQEVDIALRQIGHTADDLASCADAWQSQLDAKDARIAELEDEVLEAQARLSEYGH